MFVNSSQLTDIRKSLRVYNLYPYIVNTVDIYFITSNAVLQDDILSLDSAGNPRLVLSIDGNKYPLQFKLPGESPRNPISYTKSIDQAKFSVTERNTLTNSKVTGFVGSDKIAGWIPGTNINDLDDYIEIKIEVKSVPTQTSTRYGYGCSPSLITSDNLSGKYGYGSQPDNNNNVISYGGYGNDFVFADSAIIIETSSRKTYDYLRNDSSEVRDSSLIHGWGEGVYGGDEGFGFGE